MTQSRFDHTQKDAMAMPLQPREIADVDLDRYEAFAFEADQRYAEFLRKKAGVAVWQRVRAGEVFRDACRDMRELLRWQSKESAESVARDMGGTAEPIRGTFSGLDLKVGGEGMKGYYDEIVPAAMTKLAKKWGAKTGETQLPRPRPGRLARGADIE